MYQRRSRARTFMRLQSMPVRLVTIDEPSSALDPAGEFKLFSHLREARNGRTDLRNAPLWTPNETCRSDHVCHDATDQKDN